MGIRVGGAVVVVALVVVLIVVVTGGSSSGPPPGVTNPHIARSSRFRPPCPPRGCSRRPGRPVPRPSRSRAGPKLATLLNAATGQTVDGIQCQTNEQMVLHVHTHLTIFVNGKAQVIPYGIGIPGFQAVTRRGALRPDGKLLLLAARPRQRRDYPHRVAEHHGSFTLGQFFDEWGIPLSKTQVGPATGNVTVFFTSPGKKAKLYTGNPRDIPLGDHYQIQLDRRDADRGARADHQLGWAVDRESACGSARRSMSDATATSGRRGLGVVVAQQRGEDGRRPMGEQGEVTLAGHQVDGGLRDVRLRKAR